MLHPMASLWVLQIRSLSYLGHLPDRNLKIGGWENCLKVCESLQSRGRCQEKDTCAAEKEGRVETSCLFYVLVK